MGTFSADATIMRPDGTTVAVIATITTTRTPAGLSDWSGRAVVRTPESLFNDAGQPLQIRIVKGGGYLVGDVLITEAKSGQDSLGLFEEYRLMGSGGLTEVSRGI